MQIAEIRSEECFTSQRMHWLRLAPPHVALARASPATHRRLLARAMPPCAGLSRALRALVRVGSAACRTGVGARRSILSPTPSYHSHRAIYARTNCLAREGRDDWGNTEECKPDGERGCREASA
ncbi:hypothetical protein GUJ93_ZPchr0013g35299 [Zizania palustris]|uniref:Uncharacterized protein n=1 Tax=Zizania palustris TaxID=103762 RepID=A0A8J5WVM4_ZIZPA|nr:hypothetical protein GUJ93_ZPchr0013g35299 [Zizania palustris]